jgi:hypothetical protein
MLIKSVKRKGWINLCNIFSDSTLNIHDIANLALIKQEIRGLLAGIASSAHDKHLLFALNYF